MSGTFSRRRFLVGGAAAGAAVASAGVASAAGFSEGGDSALDGRGIAPLHGAHQAQFLRAPAPATAVVSFDTIVTTKAELQDLFATLSARARILSAGEAVAPSDPSRPPLDNGILGPSVAGGQLGIVVGVGASLFDSRYGLASAKPAGLTGMRTFPNDHLDPALSGGDISVQLMAASSDIVVHALRDITKYTRGGMQPRWRMDGFSSPPRPSGAPRNLFGFNDGISNPDVDRQTTLNRMIWAATDGSQPAWTAGGSFQVIRIIRQLVEFWDRVSLQEQELMIGRRRANGAPLDANSPASIPDYHADPQGAIIPLDAHIRLANPRTPKTEDTRILRRAWNYDLGLDVNGNLNQGLIFTCYQQDIARQFEATQTRLINEPMVDYISPIGGGYFFVLPGLRDASDIYGRGMF